MVMVHLHDFSGGGKTCLLCGVWASRVSDIMKEACPVATRNADTFAEFSARTVATPDVVTANSVQIGGDHYHKCTGLCPHCGGEIQHWDLYARMPYLEGVATKYITRWQEKGGLEDLKKARHYIDKLIEVAEAEQKNASKK